MTDYSDIFFLMGAMVMFSFLTLSVNRTLLTNEMNRVGHESNYYALTVAQESIDELRWVKTEAELDAELDTYPKTINYKNDTDQDASIPFSVNINKTTSVIETDDVRTIELVINVQNDYGIGGEGSSPIQLLFTKSFLK
ncbi:MAG TPA: hypothetical protein VJ915_01420 [Balneolaceae bacterium]|nr:hypothetical protein [Balneolaceae bacterium]